MKQTLENIGGLLFFYLVIVVGVLLLSMRFNTINSNNYVSEGDLIAYKE